MIQALWLSHASSAYLVGSASIVLGLLAIFLPSFAANLFGISLPASPSSSSLQNSQLLAFLAAKGARDITIGILYLVFGYEAEFRMMRILMLEHMITGVVDAVVAWNSDAGKGEEEKRQWSFGLGTVGLVVALAVGF
jgi:uncharacterized membrane protein HdeD (DUF308 family)